MHVFQVDFGYNMDKKVILFRYFENQGKIINETSLEMSKSLALMVSYYLTKNAIYGFFRDLIKIKEDK